MTWTKEGNIYLSSLGYIYRERGDKYFYVKGGWYWWPPNGFKKGPFSSARKAKEYAEFKR